MRFLHFIVLCALCISGLSTAIPVTQTSGSSSVDPIIAARTGKKASRPATRPKRPPPARKPHHLQSNEPVIIKPKHGTAKPTPIHQGHGSVHNTTAPHKACPVRKPTKPHKAAKGKVARAFDAIVELFRRDEPLFIGWHGTNSHTAAVWKEAQRIQKPGGGGSGADHEIGDGLYVTDERFQAWVFARTNAHANHGTHPAVCAIFARSKSNFLHTQKVWIPWNLRGDAASAKTSAQAKVKHRTDYLKAETGLTTEHDIRDKVALFSALDPNEKNNQVMLPTAMGIKFYAECITFRDADVRTTAEFEALAFPHTGRAEQTFANLRRAWNIEGARDKGDVYVLPPDDGCIVG